MPDSSVITNGLKSEFQKSTKKALVFMVCKSKLMYPNPLGWPQEYISITFPGAQTIDWAPATAAGLDTTKYFFDRPYIVDYKLADLLDDDFNAIGIEMVFLKYSQKNRLVYTDCTGAAQTVELSEHQILYRKKSNTTYWMEEAAAP
jgi:hypothetical protein